MPTIVLVPLDGSEKDHRALEAAITVSELSGGTIHLLRVMDIPVDSISGRGEVLGMVEQARETRANMERSTAFLAKQLADSSGRRVTSEVGENFDVAQAILDRISDGKTEFVVMATRAAGTVTRAIRGSVADRVMRESSRPVFLVPPRSDPDNDAGLRKILVPLDGSTLALSALDALLRFERAADLNYLLVEVIPSAIIDEPGAQGMDPSVLPQIVQAHEDAHRRLHAAALRLHDRGARFVDVRVLQAADEASALNLAAREAGVDLIAMSSRGHGGIKRFVLGSVAEGVVRGSHVPVLLFPPAGRATEARKASKQDPQKEFVNTNDPRATVERLFAAFGARDLDALLATVHPESRWTYYGANPRLSTARFNGHTSIRRFFERILERLDIAAFNPVEYVVQGNSVVVFGNESGTVRATGQPFMNEWTQKYVVKDNRIVEMTEYNIQVETLNDRTQPRAYPDIVDDTLDDSFPASDPPSWASE